MFLVVAFFQYIDGFPPPSPKRQIPFEPFASPPTHAFELAPVTVKSPLDPALPAVRFPLKVAVPPPVTFIWLVEPTWKFIKSPLKVLVGFAPRYVPDALPPVMKLLPRR